MCLHILVYIVIEHRLDKVGYQRLLEPIARATWSKFSTAEACSAEQAIASAYHSLYLKHKFWQHLRSLALLYRVLVLAHSWNFVLQVQKILVSTCQHQLCLACLCWATFNSIHAEWSCFHEVSGNCKHLHLRTLFLSIYMQSSKTITRTHVFKNIVSEYTWLWCWDSNVSQKKRNFFREFVCNEYRIHHHSQQGRVYKKATAVEMPEPSTNNKVSYNFNNWPTVHYKGRKQAFQTQDTNEILKIIFIHIQNILIYFFFQLYAET